MGRHKTIARISQELLAELSELEELILLTGFDVETIFKDYGPETISRKAWVRGCRYCYLKTGHLPSSTIEVLAIWMNDMSRETPPAEERP